MKTTLKLFILTLVIFAVSCKKEMNQEPGSTSAMHDNSAAETNSSFNNTKLIDENLILNPIITLATENEDFSINNDGLGDDETDEMKDKKIAHPLCFIKCLNGLNLDSTQTKALRFNFMKLHDCKANAVKRIRAINDSILHFANIKRANVIKAYKDGKINKLQLTTALEALHKQVHALLVNHPIRKMLIKEFVNCYDIFKINLSKILTLPQQKSFVACMSKC